MLHLSFAHEKIMQLSMTGHGSDERLSKRMTPAEIHKLNELIAKGDVEVRVVPDIPAEVPRVTEKTLRPENVRDVRETTGRYLTRTEDGATSPPSP